MSLKKNLRNIKKFILKRYGGNLAAILIFGSANTNHFNERESDVDVMIFLKRLGKLNINRERKFLFGKLKSEKFATQYFHTLKTIKEYIQKRKSFSTYATIVSKDGSTILYTTSEFEKTRKYLEEHPFTKKEIQKSIIKKDKFELEGYFKKERGFVLTKGLMSHLRRKLQIVNYFENKDIKFDYEKCLKNIKLDKEKKQTLKKLYNHYKKRAGLSKEEIQDNYKIAEYLTKQIISQ